MGNSSKNRLELGNPGRFPEIIVRILENAGRNPEQHPGEIPENRREIIRKKSREAFQEVFLFEISSKEETLAEFLEEILQQSY